MAPASPRSGVEDEPVGEVVAGVDVVEDEPVAEQAVVEDGDLAKPSLRGMIFGGGGCGGSFLQLCRGGMQSTLRL